MPVLREAIGFAPPDSKSDTSTVAVPPADPGEAIGTTIVALRFVTSASETSPISGGVCGFAGFLAVSAVSRTLSESTADGRGFTAVLVSWLAKFNPVWMILTSFLLVFLSKGGSEIASNFGLSASFGDILTGIILFFIIGSEFFINYKINFRKSGEKEAK